VKVLGGTVERYLANRAASVLTLRDVAILKPISDIPVMVS
jgi:hypothetical protein